MLSTSYPTTNEHDLSVKQVTEGLTTKLIFCGLFIFSVLGGILLVGGLYSFLWAKSKEQMIIPSSCSPIVEADKGFVEFKIKEGTKNSPSIV